MQHTKTQTMQSPFKQTFGKTGGVTAQPQKKTTPQSHLRQKYVQMMNSTTQSSFVRSGAVHGSGKDLLAKQVQLPQISKQDSKKTFNRIRSEQRQAVNRHYANFSSGNYQKNQMKRKNLSSQPKVLTIGQVLLEQQKRTPQLPNITAHGNLSGHLSRNKELNQMIIDSTISTNIENRKQASQSGLKQGILHQVQREQQLQKLQSQLPSEQYQALSKKQEGSRPARIYTAKLTSGTVKNFFFNNQSNNQMQPQQSSGQNDHIYAASPNPNIDKGNSKALKNSNRSCMMNLSSNKFRPDKRQNHAQAFQSSSIETFVQAEGKNDISDDYMHLSQDGDQQKMIQILEKPSSTVSYPTSTQPQLIVLNQQPEVIQAASASLDVIDSPQPSAPNFRKPSISGMQQKYSVQNSILNQHTRQHLTEPEQVYPMQRRTQNNRQQFAIIHYSSSQTQLHQLNANQDFLFDEVGHGEDSGSVELGDGSSVRHPTHTTGTSCIPIRKLPQQVANTGNPRRTLYSAKHVSQVYRPQPISYLPATNKQVHLLSAKKKKQSMQITKQNGTGGVGGAHFKPLQNTQQQFYSKAKQSQQIQVVTSATAATTGSHQVSSRPAHPVQSTNINSAPKSSVTGGKQYNVQQKKRIFVNQTASEIFVGHNTQQHGSFHTGNPTTPNQNNTGVRRSQVKAAGIGGRLASKKDEIMSSQQNSSMVQLNNGSGSPKQATKRQRPVATAVSTTMTPDLSQKFILFKENRKRASINPSIHENQPSAVKSTTDEQFQHVQKPSIQNNRVHSTLAKYNNNLNFDQPTASQSPQGRDIVVQQHPPPASDLNQMLLSNLIHRGGYSRDNSAVYEQSRSASQMQYKTKPEPTNNSKNHCGISFKPIEGHRESLMVDHGNASPQFNTGLQRSETHDNRKISDDPTTMISQSASELQQLQPQLYSKGGDGRSNKLQVNNGEKTLDNLQMMAQQQSQTGEQLKCYKGEQKNVAAQGGATAAQQQSDNQHIMKKRLVYSSYLRKSTQNETMVQRQHQGAYRAEYHQQNVNGYKPTYKGHLRHNIRKK